MPDTPHQHGHRERLRDRFSKDFGRSMPDYEILEMLLALARPRIDTKPLAKRLIARFGSLAGVFAADAAALRELPGVGEATVTTLKLTREAGLRLARAELAGRDLLTSWDQVVAYCEARLAHEATEHFHVLFLDKKNRLIADEVQQRGTVDHTPVYPREVVKRALELGATALIMVHNHPSGDPDPSDADVEITRAVIKAAAPLDIAVHDHIVIGRGATASLRSLGLM